MKVVGFINRTVLVSQLSGKPESDCYEKLTPQDYYSLEFMRGKCAHFRASPSKRSPNAVA